MKTDRPVATGETPAASPEKGGGWMVKWPPPAAHLQTQQVFETEREAHHWVRMNVASWTRDIGYEVCPVFTEPTPNSETEKVGDEDEMRALREDHKLAWDEVHVLSELRHSDKTEIRALLEALEKIIAEVSERRVGHREKIAEIARTAIDQARGD